MSDRRISRTVLVVIRQGSLVFGGTLAAVGGILSLCALKLGADSWASPLISFFSSWLPIGRLSMGSTFPLAGPISVIFFAPIMVFSFTGNVADILIDYRPKWGVCVDLSTRLKAVIASLFLITVAAVLLFYWKGGDVRVLKFGSSVLCMAFLGWVPFWLFGFLFAYGAVGFWKSITH